MPIIPAPLKRPVSVREAAFVVPSVVVPVTLRDCPKRLAVFTVPLSVGSSRAWNRGSVTFPRKVAAPPTPRVPTMLVLPFTVRDEAVVPASVVGPVTPRVPETVAFCKEVVPESVVGPVTPRVPETVAFCKEAVPVIVGLIVEAAPI